MQVKCMACQGYSSIWIHRGVPVYKGEALQTAQIPVDDEPLISSCRLVVYN